MTNEHQFIHDSGDTGNYGVFVPRIVDEELDPFETKLWLHYKQVCAASKHSACFEKVETTAKKAKMSAGMVVKTRDALAARGWIIVSEHPIYRTKTVEMTDLWPQNVERYGSRSCGEPIVVIPDLSVLDSDQQQQLSFVLVHSMNLPPQIEFLINHCGLLDKGLTADALGAWLSLHGADRLIECARWYCYARDTGKARGAGWLVECLAQGWSQPDGFMDHMYLSDEDNAKRYANTRWKEIES